MFSLSLFLFHLEILGSPSRTPTGIVKNFPNELEKYKGEIFASAYDRLGNSFSLNEPKNAGPTSKFKIKALKH